MPRVWNAIIIQVKLLGDMMRRSMSEKKVVKDIRAG